MSSLKQNKRLNISNVEDSFSSMLKQDDREIEEIKGIEWIIRGRIHNHRQFIVNTN